ncbi:MAG TPA: hypothetical protein VE944_25015 [Nostoc sp.]|nr:hypothetical protein [Nostoc sp.]HYX17554.1 hypothetical protein [Nostoc sp.]
MFDTHQADVVQSSSTWVGTVSHVWRASACRDLEDGQADNSMEN